MVGQGFCGAMGNYAFENLDSFFHQTNEIILNKLKALQSNLFKRPPL